MYSQLQQTPEHRVQHAPVPSASEPEQSAEGLPSPAICVRQRQMRVSLILALAQPMPDKRYRAGFLKLRR